MLSPEEKAKRLEAIRQNYEEARDAWEREGGSEGRRGWTHRARVCYEHAKARYEWALKGYFHWEPGYGLWPLMTEEQIQENEARQEKWMQDFLSEVDEWKKTRGF